VTLGPEGIVVAEAVADMLVRVAGITGRIRPLVVEPFNHADVVEQARQLRDLGRGCWCLPLLEGTAHVQHLIRYFPDIHKT